ncbi:MAG: helix-turn-helix transcriptional regulator [Lachnospiraceae bacterium]|nr:helix-turn-helix transcriptional regulator [Lachnospiraceae bacterium]
MINEYRGLVRTKEDGSEIINYDDPTFPSYIHDGYVYSGCTWEKVTHFHKDVELLSVHSSCMGYSVNGNSIFLEKGDTLFVNSDQLHYSYALPPKEGRYIIAVMHPRILCSNYAVEAKAILPVTGNKKVPFIHFHNGDRDAARMQELMLQLEHKAKGNEFLITKVFYEIWELILDRVNESGQFSPDDMMNQDLHNEVLKAMMNYVDKNYMNSITLNEVASAGGISKSLCNSIFNKYTQMTPIEYIMHFRARKVADLLQAGTFSMSEIAEMTGFSGASYMAETFKKFYNLSPREYKKAMNP